ncbi:hypothetical protein [Promicromonospora iranensis]|uniref:Uncharacterized protein n=1 Tax=Promicromonospora iranensis TaxID=1105144 RepID=A0ABU2CJ18_9MICO|nr:hypothetical protein [Promicromonospora iranensis]MDR7381182.1 hypothetical protein [Promicromonospora iranensis]
MSEVWHEIRRPDFTHLIDLTEDTTATAGPGSNGLLDRIYADADSLRRHAVRLRRRAS